MKFKFAALEQYTDSEKWRVKSQHQSNWLPWHF